MPPTVLPMECLLGTVLLPSEVEIVGDARPDARAAQPLGAADTDRRRDADGRSVTPLLVADGWRQRARPAGYETGAALGRRPRDLQGSRRALGPHRPALPAS